jgi:hypothetical protein
MFDVLVFVGFVVFLSILGVRFLGAHLGLINPDEPAEHAISAAPPGSSPDQWVEPSAPSLSRTPRRSWFGTFVSVVMLVGLGAAWAHFGSFDRAFGHFFPGLTQPAISASIAPAGSDWAVIDEVRWFKVVGTDSAGIGFSGWVSEMAFQKHPPVPSGETKNLLEKAGLPTVKERVKAMKQLQSMGDNLKKQLKRN